MTDLIPFLKDFTPGSYGIWTIALMVAAWLAKEHRENRRMSVDDRQAKREGFSRQVSLLQDENRRLRSDLADAEERHENYRHSCQQETDQLRRDVRGLEDQVTGLKRTLASQASTIGRAVLGFDAPTSIEKFGEDAA